jgi:hypothetical protein
MPFWLALLLYVGFTVISELLRPKPKFGAPAPSSLGDFNLPTAQEGRAIPAVFGTCKIGGPNVVWYGDLVAKAATKNVKTGMFSSDNIVIAYLYHLGAMLVLCHGEVDDVLEVRFDDRPVPGGGFDVNAGNKGIAFGQIPDETVRLAAMTEGNYKTGALLAAEAEDKMAATFGSNWRCVYGFHVAAGRSDTFVYAVRRSSDNLFDADTTATLAAGAYDTAGYAAALVAAIVSAEAGIGGGPRVVPSVSYAQGLFGLSAGKSVMRITLSPARAGYNGWKLRGAAIAYTQSTLPLVGARLGFDKTIGTMPGVYEAPNPVGVERFMFAKETEIGKLLTAHAGFTSADLLGLDRTGAAGATKYRPNHTWSQGWGVVGYGGPNAMSAALADDSDGTYGRAGGGEGFGDLCGVYGAGVQLAPVLDPGDTGAVTLRFRAQRFGSESAGVVTINCQLYGGQLPIEEGGAGTAGTVVKSLSGSPGFGAGWADFEVTLSGAEVASFRSTGGFTTGARISMLASSSGLGNCNNKGVGCSRVEVEVTMPNYKIIRHHRGYREVATTGLLFTDLGNGRTAIDINQPTLFGGTEREGGVKGRIDFYRGTLTQVANDYLEAKIGASMPAFRGICYAVLRGLYVGTSPYLKAISFVVRRTPNQLGLPAGRHNIGGDANPACILYEILTNDRWGLGIPAAQVSVASFLAVGDALYAEGSGLSMVFDGAAAGRDLIGEVLRHVDGVLYTDPQTGLLSLSLARDNYGPGDPLLLDESNVDEVKIGRPAWDETRNVVKLNYIDRANNFTPRVAQEQDLANVQARGGEISEETYDFRGISNAAQAQRWAARVLKTVSHPLAPVELKASRVAWQLRPGSVARLRWSPLGIVDMVIRVTRLGGGTLKRGQIKIDAVEDVFAVSGTGYLPPAPSGWIDPIAAPAGLADARLVECPYALVVGPDRLVLALGAQAAAAQLGFQVWADAAGGSKYALSNEVRELTPTGTLTQGLGYAGGALTMAASGLALLQSASDADFAAGRNIALLGEEFIAWQFISDNGDGTFTLNAVVRGVADTVPALHLAGARVWFVTDGAGLTSRTPYGSDLTLGAKLLAFTGLGVQVLDEVSALAVTTNARAQRPYVPRDVTVDATAYPVLISASDITVNWRHRSRLAEWSWADGGITAGPEPGQTYTLRFYGEDGLLKRTYSGLAGVSQTWDTEVANAGSRQQAVRITLEGVVGSLVSFQMFDLTVYRSIADVPRRSDLPVGARRRRLAGRRVVMDTGHGGE